ncbi:MAG: hypothetical protein HYS38_00750 [Acidobacteria bacterium]|nr:hypothetical protein [Acidobacteriota bacterium]
MQVEGQERSSLGDMQKNQTDAGPHPLAGIREKLKRAEENIINLEREINLFLDYGGYGSVSDNNVQAIEKLRELHLGREVPIRFSVLAGEIIHQMRSALDHLAWQLSNKTYREKCPAAIEFPIFKKDPTKENKTKEYTRKVQGISPPAQAIIESLQPYKGNAPGNHLLQIIHEMDITEKHRELIFITGTFRHIQYPGWQFPGNRGSVFQGDAKFPYFGITKFDPKVDVRGQIAAQVAFAEFGVLKYQPIIPSLKQLLDGAGKIISLFEEGSTGHSGISSRPRP